MRLFNRNPRVQDIVPGDRLPVCAGGVWYGRKVVSVFHGHYPHVGNYARFMLKDGAEVEFRFGRSWKGLI
jgi:hypothetical protein